MSFRFIYLSSEWAGDETSELERIFCESQIFLKYFRSFSTAGIFEIARDQSPNDLHVAAEGSWKPIFLKECILPILASKKVK